MAICICYRIFSSAGRHVPSLNNLCTIPQLLVERSTVKLAVGISADGRAACSALEEHLATAIKAAIHDASARLAARKLGHEKSPEIFSHGMGNDREHLRFLGGPVSDIHFEDLTLRALPPAYEYFRQLQRLNPHFAFDGIKAAILIAYRDWLSRDECSPSIGDLGTAMRADARLVKCHQCGQQWHLKWLCPENKRTIHKQDDKTGRKGRGRKGNHCSHHGKCGHSTAECRVLNKQSSTDGRGPVSYSLLVLTAAPLRPLQH